MNPAGIELLCIGNALVDVFAEGEEHIDARFGLTEPVQHISMETMREILAVLPEFEVVSGGGAANVAKIAGFLGVRTAFIGAAGRDRFGAAIRNELSVAGVLVSLVDRAAPTGVCLILKMGDGRTVIAACPSAALELAEQDLDEALIKEARVLVIDGFMLGRTGFVRRVLELADRHGTAVALDLSSTDLAGGQAHQVLTWSRVYPLILFMNGEEARAFYQAVALQSEDPRERAQADKTGGLSPAVEALMRDLTANSIFPVITVKLGARGAVAFAGGNTHRAAATPVIPLETTGAGDVFCAAFLAAWLRKKSVAECAAIGNRAAKEALHVNGTRIDPASLRRVAGSDLARNWPGQKSN